MKPPEKKKPTAKATDRIRKTLASLPRRIWVAGGAVALVMVVAWWMHSPAEKAAGPTPAGPVAATENRGTPNLQPLPTSNASPDAGIPEQQRAFIAAVRLEPSQPTRNGTLKAEITVAPNAPKRLAFTYVWKVNNRTIRATGGDTLLLSDFQKKDRITVTVTPRDGTTEGFAVVSPEVAINGIPPSLEMEIKEQKTLIGAPVELQLVSVAPDSTQVTFSLEAPHVPGMIIDKQSGKITWLRQPGQQGSFRFGAAVEDDNQTKVTKIFDITVR